MLAPLYYDQDCKAIVGKGHNFLSFRVIKVKALKGIKNEGRASCESLGALAERSQRLSDRNKNGTNDLCSVEMFNEYKAFLHAFVEQRT